MSFILLGILNSQAAGAVGGAGDYDLLETTVLTSSASSVSFTSLNSTYGSTYKHLQIRMTARTDRASIATETLGLRFNSDSSSIYASHFLTANGSSVSSSAFTSQTRSFLATLPTSTNASNIFGGSVIDILDFAETKNKTVRELSGAIGSFDNVALKSSLYASTGTINSIDLFPDAGNNFVTGSRFSLYGWKAA